jgi:hypothetical protein
MKHLFAGLLCLMFTVGFISCKKEDCPTPEQPVNLSGTTWAGTAVINTLNYDPFTLAFNSDGTATVKIGSFSPFNGSWNKTPNSNEVNFFFDESNTIKWKGKGTLNADKTKLESGTVTRITPSVYTGTFTVNKQ